MTFPEDRGPRTEQRPRFSPWAAVAVFVAAQVASIVGAVVALGVSGEDVDDPGWATMLGLAVGLYATTILGCLVVSRARGSGSLRDDFGLVVRLHDAYWLVVGVVLLFCSLALVWPLVQLVDEGQSVVEDLESASGAELVILAVMAGLLAPITEELLFRGLLLRSLLVRMSPAWSIAISALAFGLVHPLLDRSLGTLARTPAFVFLGAVSAYQAWRTSELSRSILLHIGFNLVTVTAVLLS